MTAPAPVLARAQAMLEVGRPQEALSALATLPASDVMGPIAARLRCAALAQLGRWPEAGEAARAALATNGPDPDLLYWLARAEQDAGHASRAEQILLDGLAVSPHDVDLLCAYADLCAGEGQLDKAAKLVALAAAQDPQAAIVYATRVKVAYAGGHDREAQRISQEFVANHPANPVANALLGGVSAVRGQIRPAYDGFRRAVAEDPTDRAYAESALEMRMAAHPLMLPLRPILRFGALKVWLTAVALIFGLRLIGLPQLAFPVGLAWLAFCVYSWVVPPLVRRWVRRRW
ncbi:tetratricopeptide repeat protein [Actinoplanes sp. NPDC051513]|uniref:tetratricopeptide repeat protein n=1 Tax=Actinoplanes sp. NPDC051513 TaxID=3363908 RepID=UPI00379270F8